MYKNPFNYIGGKYRLLSQILPLFPKNIDMFIDLFGGGGEVTLNVEASHYIYNEKCAPLVNIFKNLDRDFVEEVKDVISDWGLSKQGKQEFLKLRNYYNCNLQELSSRKNAVILYCLITHAFNYQIAFNSKGEYNMPSGAGRSYFSLSLEKKLQEYIDIISQRNITFMSNDFISVDIPSIASPNNTFVYVDPPYLITTGGYERDYFCKWSEEYERQLLLYLDNLASMGYKWALSNVLRHKGKENIILEQWAEKYNINYLKNDYKNCNYQTKDKSPDSTIEVLITNYIPEEGENE